MEPDVDRALEHCEEIVIEGWKADVDRADERRASLLEHTADDLERYLERQIDFENLMEELQWWLSPCQYSAGEALRGTGCSAGRSATPALWPSFRVRFGGHSPFSVRPGRFDMAGERVGAEGNLRDCGRTLPNDGADAGCPGQAGGERTAAYSQAVSIPPRRAFPSRLGSGTIATYHATMEAIPMKTILTFLLVLFLSGPAVAEDLPPDTLADKATKAMESGDLQKALRMVNAQMVGVEGGSFTMGCTPEQENCADDEKPTHLVQVGSFEISKYEITQELWEAVIGENPSAFGDCPQCPVETVSWDDIQAFLGKLNAGGGQYRLPSEAEWEYASRGGQQSQGFQYSGSNDWAAVAWYYENTGNRTHPVGTKASE